ncbi:MAG TPA: hypothetical protein VIF60_16005, partial [Burkholderiaceae bacterium]
QLHVNERRIPRQELEEEFDSPGNRPFTQCVRWQSRIVMATKVSAIIAHKFHHFHLSTALSAFAGLAQE